MSSTKTYRITFDSNPASAQQHHGDEHQIKNEVLS